MQVQLQFDITADEKNVPEKIVWRQAGDNPMPPAEAQVLLLSLWDPNDKATLAIDLWTKEMQVFDMSVMFHQTFLKMADTFERSTQNVVAGEMIRNFAKQFGEKLKLFDAVNP